MSNAQLLRRVKCFTLVCFCIWLTLILSNVLLPTKTSWYSRYNVFSHYLTYETNVTLSNGTVVQQYHRLSQYVQLDPNTRLNNYQVVLFWTDYFGSDLLLSEKQALSNWEGPMLYRPDLCYKQYPNCLLTTDRVYLQMAKALVFHWYNFNPEDLPMWRSPQQLWTIYNLEPPPNLARLSEKFPGWLFNVTATYRRDSDLWLPYGSFVRRTTPLPDSQLYVDLRFKSRPVAWFVSNCKTQSHREDYAKELSKIVEVDIYGRCGPFSCDKKQLSLCYEKLSREYFFYLSFENSFCTDYVTEKLFYVMQYNVIPIVYGSANYSQILPPNSYIDATQMTPQELGQLLLRLFNDTKAYLKYFEWRKSYEIDRYDYNMKMFCKLCGIIEKLQTANNHFNHQGYSKSASDVNRWFFEQSCFEPKSKS